MLSGISLRPARHLAASACTRQPVVQLTLVRCPWRRRLSSTSVVHRHRPRPSAPAAAGPQHWDAAALAARLYCLLTSDMRVHVISEASAAATLLQLRQLCFPERLVSDALLAMPQLLQRGPASWAAAVPTLLQHGWSPQQVLQMLAACPRLLDCGRHQLGDALDALQAGLNVTDAELQQLLVDRPQLLLLSAHRLQRQIGDLLTVFSQDQMARVVKRCPMVLHERWTHTSRKLNYLIETMGLTPSEVAHSSGLASPLEHIRARHELLGRCGAYTRPMPKDTAPNRNPSLTEIVDQSDEVFCQRVAKIPHREYEVFLRLLEVERHREEDSSGEDSDSDLYEPGYNKHRRR